MPDDTGFETRWWNATVTTSTGTYNSSSNWQRWQESWRRRYQEAERLREGGETPPMPRQTVTTQPTNLIPMTEEMEVALMTLARPMMRAENPGIRRAGSQVVSREVRHETLEDAIYFLFMSRFVNREAENEVRWIANRAAVPASYMAGIATAAGAHHSTSCVGCGQHLSGIAVICSYCQNSRLEPER